MKAIVGFCVALCLLLGIADAAQAKGSSLSPQQKEILQTIMDAQGGYIDAELHDAFWAGTPLSAAERKVLAKQLRGFMARSQLFLRASWESAGISLRSGRYTESDEYIRAKRDSLEALHAIQGAPTGEFDRSIANAERIIRAAADQTPMDFGGGRVAYVTEDLIATVISGIDGTLDRIDLLLMPEWKPVEKELSMAEPAVKMLLPWRLSRSVTQEEIEQGLRIPMTQYMGSLDASSFVTVTYADYSDLRGSFDFRKGMFGGARAAFEGSGLALTGQPSLEKWRGRDSVVAWAEGTADGVPISGYIRLFRPGERKGLSAILLIRQGSIGGLVGMVDGFEHKLAVIE